jgi:glycosyltransferase involved in cell wall biosynthesis
LKSRVKDIELAIFGQVAPKNPPELGFKVNFIGHLHDELSLRLLYSAIDMLVVPSRVEAFGQTATESMACKTPVVAFGATGLLDIVDHKLNGYLAKPFESEDLANGIEYILNVQNYNQICENARDKVVKEFDSAVVSKKYQDLYYKVLR